MKIIHTINQWSFGITLALYVTIIGGLLAQILLGVIQIFLAIIITIQWDKLENNIKKLLYGYWGTCAIYAIIYTSKLHHLNDYIGFLFFTLIPMSIAAYHLYITYRIKQTTQC